MGPHHQHIQTLSLSGGRAYPMFHRRSWLLPIPPWLTAGNHKRGLSHPCCLTGQWKGRVGRKAFVSLVDSAGFREAFTVDSAKDSCLLPPALRSAKHRAQLGSSVPGSLTLPHQYLQKSVNSPCQAGQTESAQAALALSAGSFLPANSASQACLSDTPGLGFFLSS